MAAVEVAAPGGGADPVESLRDRHLLRAKPGRDPAIVPIARALIGNRSAVVLKTPQDVQSRVILRATSTLAAKSAAERPMSPRARKPSCRR